MLKSSSEERIEMRVCETRRSALYRSVAGASAAFGTVPLIAVQRRGSRRSEDLAASCHPKVASEPKRNVRLTTFHTCLNLGEGAKQSSSEFRESHQQIYTGAGADVTRQKQPYAGS